MRSRTGFTLIELLVVISLLALLMAILFPVYSNARESARHKVCISNLRQIGMAAQMYVQDYDETLISPALRRSSALGLGPYSNDFLGKSWTTWPEMLAPYHKDLYIYTCPTRDDDPFLGYSINSNSSNDSYPGAPTPPGNWNEGTSKGATRPGERSYGMSEVISPANTIWFYDSNPTIMTNYNVTTWAGLEAQARATPGDATGLQFLGSPQIAQILKDAGPQADASTLIKEPWRHSGGMDIAWCDGHVSYRKPSTIPSQCWNIEQIDQPKE